MLVVVVVVTPLFAGAGVRDSEERVIAEEEVENKELSPLEEEEFRRLGNSMG